MTSSDGTFRSINVQNRFNEDFEEIETIGKGYFGKVIRG
jgi:hypothetical protein